MIIIHLSPSPHPKQASTDWTRRDLLLSSFESDGYCFVPPNGDTRKHILENVGFSMETLPGFKVRPPVLPTRPFLIAEVSVTQNKRACVEGGAQIYWPADAHKKVFPGINVIYAVVHKVSWSGMAFFGARRPESGSAHTTLWVNR